MVVFEAQNDWRLPKVGRQPFLKIARTVVYLNWLMMS
jgi:hypothetical protein